MDLNNATSAGVGGGRTAPSAAIAAIASEAAPGGDTPANGAVVVVAMPENTGWSSGPVQCSVPFSAPASARGVGRVPSVSRSAFTSTEPTWTWEWEDV